MASNEYDACANDLKTANKKAIELIEKYLRKLRNDPITSGAYNFILKKVNEHSQLSEFHKNIPSGIVQVDAVFQGPDWKIQITIDADIPPSGSEQTKHIGFEVHCTGKSKQTGHIWCEAVSKGRPGTGVGMKEAMVVDKKEETLPNGDKITFSLKTHSI